MLEASVGNDTSNGAGNLVQRKEDVSGRRVSVYIENSSKSRPYPTKGKGSSSLVDAHRATLTNRAAFQVGMKLRGMIAIKNRASLLKVTSLQESTNTPVQAG